MALTNAEKQKRWRDKRNALAKLAEQQQKNGGYVIAGKPTPALKARTTQMQARNKELERPGRGSGTASAFTKLSADARRKLKRLARHGDCSVSALIERLVGSEEKRVSSRLTPKERKLYYDGK